MAQQQILRRQVLNAFKSLHRARQVVFRTDDLALTEGRKQINQEFRKNQNETDLLEIRKMIALAQAVDKELRNNVIQAVQKDEGVYELRITEETTRLDNVMFDPNADIPTTRRKGKATAVSGCCGGSPTCAAAIKEPSRAEQK